jgi:hypothetical protein
MTAPCATHNLASPSGAHGEVACRRGGRWYVAPALGRNAKSALRSGQRSWAFPALLATSLTLGLSACGGSEERQDTSEPSGKYPLEVVTSKFPLSQRLAESTDLKLGVENTGDKTIPNLAVTIFTGGGAGATGGAESPAAGSFAVREDNPALANPNRPVWILENKYPRIEGDPAPKGSSPGTVAQTNTFGFGELSPGDRMELVWKLTPVQSGTYTVNYEFSAGLYGNAKAVDSSGAQPKGKFLVTITDRPPQARVNDAGQVETTG